MERPRAPAGVKGAALAPFKTIYFLSFLSLLSESLLFLFSLQLFQRLACLCPVLSCFVKLGVELFKAGGEGGNLLVIAADFGGKHILVYSSDFLFKGGNTVFCP